jgi:hypothetical protein
MKSEGGTTMQKPSAVLIYSGIGLASFGAAYDSGFFGATDGCDHSAVFAVPVVTGTIASISGPTSAVVNSITGDTVVAPLPSGKRPQHQT